MAISRRPATFESEEDIGALVARQRRWHGLEGVFYRDERIYRREIERIWRRSWLFAGHTCQIPEPGDFFLLEVDTDSVIVLRGDGGEVRAFHNVCRHRGTRLCVEESGRVGRIVCPYHQWVFSRSGELVSCRGMQDGIDRAALGLRAVHVWVVEGFIFVCLADRPPDRSAAGAELGPMLRPQGFERARVAKVADYDVAADWKVVWENNRECYHCNVNHPQYIRANFDHYNEDDATEAIRERIEAATRRSEERWRARGLAVTHRRTGMAGFPSGDRWFAVNRTPLVEGYVSETMDGKQAAPLMGDYPDADVGTLRLRTLPNMWNHSSCDHCVTTRLLPAGQGRTRVRVIWLVDRDAVEGRDYELDRLLPFWKLTSEQDWEICERVQLGVVSSGYAPGPLSTFKEYNVEAFLRWYLRRLGGGGDAGGAAGDAGGEGGESAP